MDITEIRENLWIGAKPVDWNELKGFELIVMCAPLALEEIRPTPPCRTFLAGFEDGITAPTHDALFQIDAAIRETTKGVQAGKKTIVLCREGKNRSGLVVASALSRLDGITGEEAMKIVREKRPGALRNWFFQQILHPGGPALQG